MAFSFRASPEVQTALAELMNRWKCNRTKALSRAVLEAAGVEASPEPKSSPGRLDSPPRSVSSTKLRRTVPKPEWK